MSTTGKVAGTDPKREYLSEPIMGVYRKNLEKGEKGSMSEKSFMTVDEVAAELRVSKSKAYEVVRELNAEMEKQGYLTFRGRVNTAFFHKKVCYSD